MTHPVTRKITKALREGAVIAESPATSDEIRLIFPPNRIAVAMILGDTYKHEEIIRTVNSLKAGEIHKLFIAYNGKSRSTLTWLFRRLKKIDLPFLVQKFTWEDDFAKARQQSFDMVPKEEFDWIMWIDADDELVVEKPLAEMFESLDEYTQGIYLRYDYAVDENDQVSIVQWRERILSTKVDWQWKYPIHEAATSPIGTQFARRDHAYIKHMRTPGEDRGARERNRRIVSKALLENPDDPRMQFYFATEVMAEADALPFGEEKARVAKAAIVAYKRYLNNTENTLVEDIYLAATRIGDLYLMARDPNSAIDAYLNALKIMPEWPEAFIGIARAAYESEEWSKCISFANIALKMPMPQTPAALTPLTYKYTPTLLRGLSREQMGFLNDAREDFLEAQSVWNPPDGMLDERVKEIERKIAVTASDKDERKLRRGSRPDKSIAFVTAPLPEPWHPELEKVGGAGGAETCIMRLAPRFAADGWRTVVFGTPGVENRGVDENGVEWWNSQEYVPNEKFKVVIGSRVPELFAANIAAQKKYLWMHDVNTGPTLMGLHHRPDYIVGLTNWHINHLSKLYGASLDRFAVIPNGIEIDLYDLTKRDDSSDDLRMIWSSSPDRGLGTLISLWPTIRTWYPGAKLDVFYGWNIIDKLIAGGGKRAGWLFNLKQQLMQNIESAGGAEAGIVLHGRVPQSELAEWQLKAHIWPYPTDFMETFCITAIEMQAAGVIPITSKLAALNEVVANQGLLVEGWPLNKDYQVRWLKVLESVVEAPEDQQLELQETGRMHAQQFTWDASYNKWNDLFRRTDGI